MTWPVRPKGRHRHRAGTMNRTEEKYALTLNALQYTKQVVAWWFEEWKFRLADRTWYTPDFVVMLADGSLEIHECKGHMEDDAAVKIKAVAEKFPLPIKVVKWRKGGGWDERSI